MEKEPSKITLAGNVETLKGWVNDCKTLEQLKELEKRIDEYVSYERFPKEKKTKVWFALHEVVYAFNMKSKELNPPKTIW